MKKTQKVLWYEVITLVSRFSFWFGTIGIPLLTFLIFSVVSVINQRSGSSQAVTETLAQFLTQPSDSRPQGYVDPGELIQILPSDVNQLFLVKFSSETDARKSLDNGEIRAYFLISPEYLETGEITLVTADFNPANLEDSGLIEYVLDFNLLGGDPKLLDQINSPMELEEVALSAEPVRDEDNFLTFFLPYGVTLLFYVMIMGSSSLLLSNISKEKENRVIEILMVSVTPTQLLTGKMIGLGLVGLFQMAIWGGSSYALLQMSGRTFNLPPEFLLPPEILFWGLVYFVLGYLLYACLMSGLGALVPNLREASQVTFIIALPLLVPLFLISILIEHPDGMLAILLSLFPLTAPVTMMLRLAAISVPLWQILLSIVLLGLSVFLAIRAAAGMFRAQTLLSGQEFKIKTFLLALMGRA
jgi:ABC-2 type transport system permease protein